MINCELCSGKRKSKRIIHHHLSYEPEIIIFLCSSCHRFLHSFVLYDKAQQEKIINWFMVYSSQWKNGKDKFYKSQYYKDYIERWRNENKLLLKEKQKNYIQSNKQRIYKEARGYYYRNRERISEQRKVQYQKRKEELQCGICLLS